MNSTSSVQQAYCNFSGFTENYKSVHGYLSIFVCIFGSITNVLNVCVLTTKEMRSPTNLILTGLATADLLVMLEYIPFVSHTRIDRFQKNSKYLSYKWAVFIIGHAMFALTVHFISCCLTVQLAIWRYLFISYPQKSKIWCTIKKTLWSVALIYIICTPLCLPVYFSLEINEYGFNETGTMVPISNLKNYTNDSLYIVNTNGEWRLVSYWIYGFVMKLLPCFLLTVLSWKLISALFRAKERRKNLLGKKSIPLVENKGKKSKKHHHSDSGDQADRTTKMLLAILLLFLMTEFPQAILGLLSVIIGMDFERQCYQSLGEYLPA